MKVIYKITYPNDKIYIGKDLTGALALGSVNSDLVEQDSHLNSKGIFQLEKKC